MQVCSYRVLASYESPLLERFSLCVLQKHNCLRNSADIPMLPTVKPLAVFRGKEVTFDVAEDIFLGHLARGATRRDPKPFSWRVAAGKNPGKTLGCCALGAFAALSLTDETWRSQSSLQPTTSVLLLLHCRVSFHSTRPTSVGCIIQ